MVDRGLDEVEFIRVSVNLVRIGEEGLVRILFLLRLMYDIFIFYKLVIVGIKSVMVSIIEIVYYKNLRNIIINNVLC